MTSKSEQMRDYIIANPGCSNDQIAAGTGLNRQQCSAYTSGWTKTGQVRVTKANDGKGKRYFYTWNKDYKPDYHRKKKTALPPMKGAKISHDTTHPARTLEELAVRYAESFPRKQAEQLDTAVAEHITHTDRRLTHIEKAIGAIAVPSLWSQLFEHAAEQIAEQLYQFQRKVQEKLAAKLEVPGTAETPSESLPAVPPALLLPTVPLELVRAAASDDIELLRKPEPKVALPKIAVIGFTPVEQGRLYTKFYQLFNLTLLSAEINTSKLKAAAQNCDVVFVHVRHMNHKITDCLNSYNANLRLVKGGVSQMEQAIQDYYVERHQTKS